ncbi:MAG: peptide chain release factor 3 [Chloroflexi bacterium HGW-Chloroflexi-9]|nr:MAG: peptide chain release factor 3 [Chloroflexi bacterium HGW-Chloroflexi-9]
MPTLDQEIARRRTFAIISHPDAGKTTLTEKFLLYAGAVETAGSVRARKDARYATSDWMAMERERGISVTSTVLEFDYEGIRFNLLDTPGHQDFSEDTYRTLIAADSAVMVLDAAKGIEPQTRKLYEVCRARRIPIVTFVNKMDHDALDPMELLDHVERTLEIDAAPLTWPIGDGPSFQGVYDLRGQRVLRFERTAGGRHRAPVIEGTLDDTDGALAAAIGANAVAHLRESVALVEEAGVAFDRDAFLAGSLTPVFFGSAISNFGVETLLEAIAEFAPPPGPREALRGPIPPNAEPFSGFVFKIQANMDPQHRDCMAFVRVCSGHFERDMQVYHPRSGKQIRMRGSQKLFGRERETVDEAYPGDIIGIIDPGLLGIGDTLTTDPTIVYEAIPRFEPEKFARLRNRDVLRTKQFARGLEQLEQEGAVQVLWESDGARSAPILAAVGDLQFDVVLRRLLDEYSAETVLDHLPHQAIRVVTGSGEGVRWPSEGLRLVDRDGRTVILFRSTRDADYFRDTYPAAGLKRISEA